jgi:hypothetical protein
LARLHVNAVPATAPPTSFSSSPVRGGVSANRLIEALMSHPEQLQTFTIIGLALGFVLIACGIAINWATESKIEALPLAELAFVFLLLCILIRKRIAQRPSL